MINHLSIGLMFVGLFFIMTASIGVYRFPDIYTRLHAVTKGTTLGFCFLILGVALLIGNPVDMTKALLAIVFLFLTAPVSAHMLARVAIRRGYQPVVNSRGDLAQKLPLDAAEDEHL